LEFFVLHDEERILESFAIVEAIAATLFYEETIRD